MKLKIMGIVLFFLVTLGFILGFIQYSNALQRDLSKDIVQEGGIGVVIETPGDPREETPHMPGETETPEAKETPEDPEPSESPRDPSLGEDLDTDLRKVPNLYLMPLEEARAVLLALGFTVEANYETNVHVEAERVFWQNPRRDFAYALGKPVYLTVSSGAIEEEEQTTVPNVIGLSEAVAKARLEAANLVFAVRERLYHDTAPKGNVTRQSYVPGARVEPGTTVRLTLSLGKDPAATKVTVPNLLGLSEAEALSRLSSLGLKGTVGTRAPHDTRPLGTVFAQSVASGQSVDPGSSVVLSISEGKAPKPETVTVPNLIGRTEAAAIALINELGLAYVVERDYHESDEGTVFLQGPQPGSVVEKGTLVRIVVSLGQASEN